MRTAVAHDHHPFRVAACAVVVVIVIGERALVPVLAETKAEPLLFVEGRLGVNERRIEYRPHKAVQIAAREQPRGEVGVEIGVLHLLVVELLADIAAIFRFAAAALAAEQGALFVLERLCILAGELRPEQTERIASELFP